MHQCFTNAAAVLETLTTWGPFPLYVIDKATPVNLNPFKSPKLDHRECREVYRTLTSFTTFSYH